MLTFRFKLHHVICCLLFLTINIRRSDSSSSVYRCSSVDSRPSSKTFQTNLKLLLFSLTSKAPSTSGFHSNSIGETPDRVYGLALCRGDVASDVCLNCLMNITSDVAQHCMESTQGLVWYDYCLVRYNNHEFFGAIDTDRFFQNHNQTRQDCQDVNARMFIRGLVESALSQPSMFAANKLEVKKDYLVESESTRYGLVQCSRDLNTDNCRVCLNELMKDYKLRCEGLRRWRIIAGSCSIWYDDHPFFFKLTYHEPRRMFKDTGNNAITSHAFDPNQLLSTGPQPMIVYGDPRADNISSPPPSPTVFKSENRRITAGTSCSCHTTNNSSCYCSATTTSPPSSPPPPATASPPSAPATATPPSSPATATPPSAPATATPPSAPATATPPSAPATLPPVVAPKEPRPPKPPPGQDKRKKLHFLLVSIGAPVLGVLVFMATTILIFFLYRRRFNKRACSTKDVEKFLKNNGPLATKRYKYSELKKMTNSFKEKIGQGGYGSVFKGKLPNGCLVAVKVLTESKGNGQEFINEVASIGKTYHVNVVSLLGFCFQGSKRALIYEYMPNGSLEKYIYGDTPRQMNPLGWEKLYKIAIDIARGLEYLHLRCSKRILHLDIKPHNILLDEDFCPKISDFGLAKLCSTKESVISMLTPRGTMGYIAPEVHSRNIGGVSYKSDVYSYGMMVLEMVGGRKNIDIEQNTSQIYYPQWMYMRLNQQGNDIRVEGLATSDEEEMARKMVLVGLWCIQMSPADRPSMSKVVELFQGSIEDIQMPPDPFPPRPS